MDVNWTALGTTARKAGTALAAGIAEFVMLSADGEMTGNEWGAVALGVLGALGVYAIRNKPDTRTATGNAK